MFNKISAYMKDFDLFSRQIGLHMNKSNFYKTSFGGFCSALVIVFILTFFWSRISSFYSKDEVKVTTNRVFNPNPPVAYLNTERFMFALNIDQPNKDFLTRPYFNITAQQVTYELVGEKKVRNTREIMLEPCRKEHWDSMKEAYANFTELIEPFGTDFLCPVLGQKLELQGMWGSDVFSCISINVYLCKTPNDPNQKWNPVCAPSDEVEDYTKEHGYHGMNIYHSNYVLNADQPQNFFTPYINDKLYFMFVPYKQAQNCDIYFQDIEVITDESLLPTEDLKHIKFLTQENNDLRETTQLFRSDDNFVTLTLRMSPYVSVVNRQYKKVSQLMSELGGFIQIVFTCVGIVITRYNNFRFTVDLANNLYQFDQNPRTGKDKKNKKDRDSKQPQLPVSQLQSPLKHQINSFIKDSSLQNQIMGDSQRDKFQKDMLSSCSINLQQNTLNPNTIKSSPHHDFGSNISVVNATQMQPISLKSNQNPISNQINLLAQETDLRDIKPIEKFRKVVERIVNKSKILFQFLENEKATNLANELQTSQEKTEKKSFLISQFNKIVQSQNKLNVGFKYFLFRISIGKWFNTDYNKQIERATELIHTDLDICNLLDKIQSIERIKSIIFNKNQQTLLNFYQKPRIVIEKKNPSPNLLSINELQRLANSNSSSLRKKQASQVSQVGNPQINDQEGLIAPKVSYDSLSSYKSQSLDKHHKRTFSIDQQRQNDNKTLHAQFVQKQSPQVLKSVVQPRSTDLNVDNPQLNTRKPSLYELTNRKSLIEDKKNSIPTANTGIDLSLSFNNPFKDENKKQNTNVNIQSLKSQTEIKQVKKQESLQQQFSFHQSVQDIGSEDDNPEIEPHSLNIYEQEYKIIKSESKQQTSPQQN